METIIESAGFGLDGVERKMFLAQVARSIATWHDETCAIVVIDYPSAKDFILIEAVWSVSSSCRRNCGSCQSNARGWELTVLAKVAWKASTCVKRAKSWWIASSAVEAGGKETSIQLLTVASHVAVRAIAVVLIAAILDTVAVVQARVGEASINAAGCAYLSHFSDQCRCWVFTTSSIESVKALAWIAQSAWLDANAIIEARIGLTCVFCSRQSKNLVMV